MRGRLLVLGFVVVSATAFFGRSVFSQESDQEKAAKEMANLRSPGEGHTKLEPLVGKFTAKSKMWFRPGKPPIETTAESENEWVLGKRYLKQTYKGTFMGQPYEGLGLYGYDNYKKKYVVTWMDTASTSVMVTEGEADGKTITSRGEVDEPAAGPDKKTKVRTVITIEADKHTYEIFYTFAAYPDSEFRALEVVYERKK